MGFSAICWVATANSVDRLPKPLRSRMDILRVEPPGPEHFDSLIESLLLALAHRWQLPLESLPELPPQAVDVLRRSFLRHRSVRQLKRHAEGVVGALLHGTRLGTH